MPFSIKKNKTRFHILGTGSGWELAPRETPAVVYALNDYVHVEKFGIKPDKLFIMDILDSKPQIVSGQDNLGTVIKRINDMMVPLVAPVRYEEIPLSEAFPIEKAVERFGLPFFNNTIAYMICAALMDGAKEIQLFGINQSSSSEYFYEKNGVETWLAYALGMGVKVTINGEKSEVFSNKRRMGGNILYGYDATFEDVLRDKERFGESVVKKLLVPPNAFSRSMSMRHFGRKD